MYGKSSPPMFWRARVIYFPPNLYSVALITMAEKSLRADGLIKRRGWPVLFNCWGFLIEKEGSSVRSLDERHVPRSTDGSIFAEQASRRVCVLRDESGPPPKGWKLS